MILVAIGIVWLISDGNYNRKQPQANYGTGTSITKTEKQTDIETTKEKTTQDKIIQKIAGMTLEEKVAQLFIITPEALTENKEISAASEITKASLEKYPVGGLIYFSGDITSKENLKTMLSNSQTYSEEIMGLPLFLSVDEEGGKIARIANSKTIEVPLVPDMSEVGLSGDPNLAYNVGLALSSYLSELGFNLDYAPVADVLTNPNNIVVRNRSFGSDPVLVSEMVIKEIQGLNKNGVYGTLKHFPGHGATLGDSHEGYAYTDQTLEEMINDEMLPFIKGIENNVSFIMVGHISAPNIIGDNIPSSLSGVMINDILRDKLGYNGIVITDALNMGAIQNTYTSKEAAVSAFLAGSDLLLMPSDFQMAYEGMIQAVNSGLITEERIDISLKRILNIKYEIMN